MRIMGIDEAGRGCVLGPLVVGSFVVDGVSDEVLRQAGANDSKAMSAKRRVAARTALQPLGQPRVVLVPATAIDTGNLNHLEEDAIVQMVLEAQPDLVYMDALGHPRTLPALEARLSAAVGRPELRWVIEPKADATYPVVGAASIFAKTTRDQVLVDLELTWGALGSGYPSDPTTRRWLSAHAASRQDWPPFVRTRWQTVKDLAQQALFPSP